MHASALTNRRLALLAVALMTAFAAFALQANRDVGATGSTIVFNDCFDLGAGDTNCANDIDGSNTVDSNNAALWAEANDAGGGTDCRIQPWAPLFLLFSGEFMAIRKTCTVTQTLSTTGLTNVELEYDFGQASDLDVGSADGFAYAEWRVGTSGGWTTVQTHDSECSPTNLYACINHVPPDTHFSLLLGPTAANQPTIQVRFRAATPEDSDQAAFDNVKVSGDAGPPTVQFQNAAQSGAESVTAPTINVVLSSPAIANVTVDYTVTGGTASGGGTDYTLANGSFTYTAGQSVKTLPITINNDALDEDDETVIVTLSNPTGGTLGANTVHTYTIQDNDPPPTVTLSQQFSSFAESGGTNNITATLNTLSGKPVTVNLGYTGTATNGTDYSSTASILIPAGSLSNFITLTGINDFVDESPPTETVIVDITSVTNGTESGTQQVTSTITDDDQAGVTVTGPTGPTHPISGRWATTEAAGDDPEQTFTVVLTSEPTANVTIDVTSDDTTEGTIASPTGAAIPGGVQLTFTSANWNTAQTVTVTGVDDVLDDGPVDYTAVIGATVSTDPRYGGPTEGPWNPADVLLTNIDNETPAFIVLVYGNTTEGGGSALVRIRLTTQPLADVVIPSITSDDLSEGTVPGGDAGPLTFTPANWNLYQDVTVTGVDDFLDDGNIAFTLVTTAAVSLDPSYDAMNPDNATITNIDDDFAGAILTPDNGLVTTETGGTGTFDIRLGAQPAPGATVTINLSTSDATEGTVLPASVVFNHSDWNVNQTVTVTGVDDAVDDGDIAYSVVTSNTVATGDPNYNGQPVDDVSATNQDNDTAGVTVGTPGPTTTEATGDNPEEAFNVVLTSAPVANVTVNLASSNPAEGTPFPWSLTFTPVTWNLPQQVNVNGVDDSIDDGDVSFDILTSVNSADPAYGVLNPADVSFTNLDDDLPPSVQFDTAAASSSESAANVNLAIVLDHATNIPIVVDYTVTGTATATVDHTLASGSMVIPALATSANIVLPLVDDELDEDLENVVVKIDTVSYGTIGATDTRTHDIVDNDAAPNVQFNAASSSDLESVISPASLKAVLSAPSGKTVTVDYAVTGGSAGGSDYTLAAGTLTFLSGDTVMTLPLAVIDDLDVEANETVVVSLSAPTNSSMGGFTNHTYTILDDDGMPTVQFVSATSQSAESADSASLNVTLSAPQSSDVTVDFAVNVASTATNGGVDYTLVDGTLTFVAGDTLETIALDLFDDELDENPETIVVDLLNPVGATLGGITTRTHTLIDNDGPPAISFQANSSSATEGDTGNTIQVILSEVSGKTVSVNYTIGGTAGATDHTLVAGTATIVPGDTFEAISYDVLDDSPTFDEGETIVVTLTNPPTSATLGAPQVHTVTIDDPSVLAAPSVIFTKIPKYTRVRQLNINVTGGLGTTGFIVVEDRDQSAPPTPDADDPRWNAAAPTTFLLSNIDGEKTLYAWTKNAAGEVSDAAIRTIFLDRKAPVTRITAPVQAQDLTNLKFVSGVSSDPNQGSGVKRVMIAIRKEVGSKCYFWNGSQWRQRGCNNHIWLRTQNPQFWNIKLPWQNPKFDAPGLYSVFSRGADAAGNINNAKTFTLGTNWVRFQIVEP